MANTRGKGVKNSDARDERHLRNSNNKSYLTPQKTSRKGTPPSKTNASKSTRMRAKSAGTVATKTSTPAKTNTSARTYTSPAANKGGPAARQHEATNADAIGGNKANASGNKRKASGNGRGDDASETVSENELVGSKNKGGKC